MKTYLSNPIKRPKFEHKSLNSSGKELYLKAGKGYATTSLSCTNKMNRQIYQGIERTLLNQFIVSPIKLTGLINYIVLITFTKRFVFILKELFR